MDVIDEMLECIPLDQTILRSQLASHRMSALFAMRLDGEDDGEREKLWWRMVDHLLGEPPENAPGWMKKARAIFRGS